LCCCCWFCLCLFLLLPGINPLIHATSGAHRRDKRQ
jgi:hypothetical protein